MAAFCDVLLSDADEAWRRWDFPIIDQPEGTAGALVFDELEAVDAVFAPPLAPTFGACCCGDWDVDDDESVVAFVGGFGGGSGGGVCI